MRLCGRCRSGFQSTLPVGGATGNGTPPPTADRISIHAPRGGSDKNCVRCGKLREYFNPRSPWGERLPCSGFRFYGYRFQSTLPVGGATQKSMALPDRCRISIHAPRGGSDAAIRRMFGGTVYFNPRSPWGERPEKPERRALDADISIHAPRGGSDHSVCRLLDHPFHFNPRSPWGERRSGF